MYLRILSDDEIELLYGLPNFCAQEQAEHFHLSVDERALMEQLHSINSRIFFILQLGYFKARRQFFTVDLSEIMEDLVFIQETYFPNSSIPRSLITKPTRLKHQQIILSHFGYSYCQGQKRQDFYIKAQQIVKLSSRPIDICKSLIHFLQSRRIVLPKYRALQETISQILAEELDRLSSFLKQNLSKSDTNALDKLLADTSGLYEITQLKRSPRSFKETEIKQELRRGQQLRDIYKRAQFVIPNLGISRESVKYYASLVEYYSVYKLSRMDTWQVYVYLLCFANYRTQRLNDNLINCLLYYVRQLFEEARTTAKMKIFELYQETTMNMEKAGRVLKLFTSESIEANTPFHEVQDAAFSILDRDRLSEIATKICAPEQLDEKAFQWAHIDKMSRRFKRQLRPIIQALDLCSSQRNDPLIEAITFLKNALKQNQALNRFAKVESLPIEIIPKRMEVYLYGDNGAGQLQINRYEFLVYRLIREALEAGDLYCHDSIRFRSLDDDLISNQEWQNKDALIDKAGLVALTQPMELHLVELEEALEKRITEVNSRISTGKIPYFQIRDQGLKQKWLLKYPSRKEVINHPFFDSLSPINIFSVMESVDQQCPFSDAFEHALGRFTRKPLDKPALFASLLAWGTNLGLGRMSDRSDMSYQRLANLSENRIRLETLREANDRISNGTSQLPIFKKYSLGGKVHSSSDGQKFETKADTFNSRHSPKYFGLKKGIVSLSLVANHIPVNAQIIGANEHESHFVFDLLYNNTADIEIDTHSTDTHGTNQVNFALLYFFGYRFAPRFRDVYSVVTNSLAAFKTPAHYSNFVIRPVKTINRDLIISEADNIHRIVVSLAQKTTTQSIITRKLSAHARKNRTKKALWEYDSIIKSLYLLDYIDSPPLRQNVHTALNRGESFHKLRRAIAFANFGKLRFKTEREQQIWSECSRLISNCIIFYNASLLSDVMKLLEKLRNKDSITRLKSVSPVAWAHINLFGQYEFDKPMERIDRDEIIAILARAPIPLNGEG